MECRFPQQVDGARVRAEAGPSAPRREPFSPASDPGLQVVAGLQREPEQGQHRDDINFKEALGAVNAQLNDPEVPSSVRDILADPKCQTTDMETPAFWIMARALGKFVGDHGVLPLRGSIPDMHADTDAYVALQQVYLGKARSDVAAINATVQELLASVGKPSEAVSEAELSLFCEFWRRRCQLVHAGRLTFFHAKPFFWCGVQARTLQT